MNLLFENVNFQCELEQQILRTKPPYVSWRAKTVRRVHRHRGQRHRSERHGTHREGEAG